MSRPLTACLNLNLSDALSTAELEELVRRASTENKTIEKVLYEAAMRVSAEAKAEKAA